MVSNGQCPGSNKYDLSFRYGDQLFHLLKPSTEMKKDRCTLKKIITETSPFLNVPTKKAISQGNKMSKNIFESKGKLITSISFYN